MDINYSAINHNTPIFFLSLLKIFILKGGLFMEENEFGWVIIAIIAFVLILFWVWIKDIAHIIGADPVATGWLIAITLGVLIGAFLLNNRLSIPIKIIAPLGGMIVWPKLWDVIISHFERETNSYFLHKLSGSTTTLSPPSWSPWVFWPIEIILLAIFLYIIREPLKRIFDL